MEDLIMVFQIIGVIIFTFWSMVRFFLFVDMSNEYSCFWKALSRRQKILHGIVNGPLVLLITIIIIFINDTKPIRTFIYNIYQYYFNLLK